MEKKLKAVRQSTDKMPIQLDSNYFFERALKSLDMQRYDKALKYFKKAVDYEPNNPINYCNVAGVLSEMGNYDQANDILNKVIQDIDPKMTEVYFYMATNFAHMELYEEAEGKLIQYLEEDEEGHFLEEAEEMIEFLQTELPEPKKITKVRAKAGLYEHSYARELLEQGQFAEAIALLERIVEEQPDFLAAVNNLALAYYYVGFKEEAKQHMLQVLEQDSSNLHALCNLAIYYYYESELESLKQLLPSILKVEPFYQEHLYKLATTLGIMKEHKKALKHFERLIKLGEGTKDGSIYHYAAIASLNIKAYDKALRYWQLAYQYGNYEPALFYIELTQQLSSKQLNFAFTYSYFLSVEEQLTLWETIIEDKEVELYNCIVKAYFYYAKASGQREQKLQSLSMITAIANEDESIVDLLYHYILYPLEHKDVKSEALQLLLHTIQQRYMTIANTDKLVKNSLTKSSEAIIDSIVHDQNNVLTEELKRAMLTLLLHYLCGATNDKDAGHSTKNWVAALLYLVQKEQNAKVSYKQIAEQFQISSSVVSKTCKVIAQTLVNIGFYNEK